MCGCLSDAYSICIWLKLIIVISAIYSIPLKITLHIPGTMLVLIQFLIHFWSFVQCHLLSIWNLNAVFSLSDDLFVPTVYLLFILFLYSTILSLRCLIDKIMSSITFLWASSSQFPSPNLCAFWSKYYLVPYQIVSF